MKVMNWKDTLIAICISYTLISVGAAILELIFGKNTTTHTNSLNMLLWTVIAVCVLSFHYLFSSWPPIFMIITQYLIALGLVMLSVFLVSFISPISIQGYWEVFRSFTIPYLLGAIWYYISVFLYAKRQNKLLEEIQSNKTGMHKKQ